jgi:hypothetical protein
MKKNVVVFGLAAVLSSGLSVLAAWTPGEDFEGYALGSRAPFSFRFGSGENGSRTIVADFDGQAVKTIGTGKYDAGHVYEYDLHPVIAYRDSTAATFFFQAKWDSLGTDSNADTFFGLSSRGAGVYADMNVIFRVQKDRILEVHDGDYQDTWISISPGTVYNFWVVINNAANTWQLYVSTGTDDGRIVTIGGSDSSFAFRNTADTEIDTFYAGVNGAPAYFIDNMYIDTASANTTYAVAAAESTFHRLIAVPTK